MSATTTTRKERIRLHATKGKLATMGGTVQVLCLYSLGSRMLVRMEYAQGASPQEGECCIYLVGDRTAEQPVFSVRNNSSWVSSRGPELRQPGNPKDVLFTTEEQKEGGIASFEEHKNLSLSQTMKKQKNVQTKPCLGEKCRSLRRPLLLIEMKKCSILRGGETA